MQDRVQQGYAECFKGGETGLTLVEYNRPYGFLITTNKLDRDVILTKIRFNVAGVADNDIQVFGKTMGKDITVVFSGEDPHLLAEKEYAGLGCVGKTLTQYIQPINHGVVQERFVKGWYREGVFGRLQYKIPQNCTSTVEAEVKNGIVTVYIMTTEVEQLDNGQWVDLVSSRFVRQHSVKKPEDKTKEQTQPKKNRRVKEVDVIRDLVNKYRL